MDEKQTKWPYMKSTRRKHSSGYRMMEVGYITKMNDDNTVAEHTVLGECDHIYNVDFSSNEVERGIRVHIDLTMDGFFRFFDNRHPLKWSPEEFALSDMLLERADV